MKLSLGILGGLFALTSAQRCITKANAEIEALHAVYAAADSSRSSTSRRRDHYYPTTRKTPFEIPTFFHVITGGNQTALGHNLPVIDDDTTLGDILPSLVQFEASAKAVEEQLAILNDAFTPAGFSFVLNETTFINASEWRGIQIGGAAYLDMTTTLRRGDYAALNIFVTGIGLHEGVGIPWGYSTFPGRATKDAAARDGVVVQAFTLPGVAVDSNGEGLLDTINGVTLVHEVGHWLGLLHTFHSAEIASNDTLAGCHGPGDYIYDTPAQGSQSDGCQIGRDTCTGELEAENTWSMPGPDPIHNYMDYSNDECRYEFTPMQIQLMVKMYSDVRLNYVEGNFEGVGIDPELED